MILEELINKRVVLTVISGDGKIELLIVTVLGVDEKFIKIKNVNNDEHNISPPLISYIPINGIESIIDVSNDAVYNNILAKMEAAKKEASRNKKPN